MLVNELKEIFSRWDGKSANDLEAAYEHFSQSNGFAEDLLDLLSQDDTAPGASWCLKKFLESGYGLHQSMVLKFYIALDTTWEWPSKLHILQCLPFIPISREHSEGLSKFLQHCLYDKNKFVKAWAYNGMALLALQHSEYFEETKCLLNQAMESEAASIKARIRNIFKENPEFLV